MPDETDAIHWDEHHDDNDNPYYEWPSPYHDDGSPFLRRIKPVLRGGRMIWTAAESDEELRTDDVLEAEFVAVDEAKSRCEAWNREILADHSDDETEPVEPDGDIPELAEGDL